MEVSLGWLQANGYVVTSAHESSSALTLIRLQEVLENNRLIAERTQLLWRMPAVRTLGHLPLPLRVDALVVEHQYEQRNDSRHDEPQLERMAEEVPRRIFCAVEIRGHG
jgi:hypothetical protein